jgi:hypothetical protein
LTEKIIRLERLAEKNDRATTTSSKVVGAIASGAMPRTCREAHLADPSLTSGMYWIDPDGQDVGDSPIYVYCDIVSGYSTFKKLLVDKEIQIRNWVIQKPHRFSTTANRP